MDESITQSQLHDVIAGRQRVAELEEKLKGERSKLGRLEAAVIAAVAAGVRTEPGDLDCGLTQVKARSTTPWKAWFMKFCSKDQLQQVLDAQKRPKWKTVLAVMPRSLAPTLRRSVRQVAARRK